jgi:mono/diheme cytochrome c family protein
MLAAAAAAVAASGVQRPDRGSAAGEDGHALFATYCASCHGVSARGDGPVAPALRIRPADLTQLGMKNGGVFPVARTQRIVDGRDVGAHGNPDMPVWGRAFKTTQEADTNEQVKARIAAIVRYLESIQERPS